MNNMKEIFGVFRVQKIKVSNGGGLSRRIAHNLREVVSDNIDRTRLDKDEVHLAQSRDEIIERIHRQWDKATTRRSDNVGVIEVLITTTGKLPQGREEDFLEDSVEQIRQLYGAENLVNYVVHRDEKETHIHAFVVPLETKRIEKTRLSLQEETRLKAELRLRGIEFMSPPKKPGKEDSKESWDRYKTEKKAYEKYKKTIKPILEELGINKTETLLSAQKICGDKFTLSRYQDLFYETVFRKYGLARGEKLGQQKKMNPTSLKKWQENLQEQEENLQEEIQNFNFHQKRYNEQKKKRIDAVLQMLKQGNYEQRTPEELRKDIIVLAEALGEKAQKMAKKEQNQGRER